MTASNNSDDETVDLSDNRPRFQTAREYYESDDRRPDGGEGPTFAKTIVWYDQTTPIFCCCRCHEHVGGLRFEGEHFGVDDYEERRALAYERLMNNAPECDVCAGRLPEMMDR